MGPRLGGRYELSTVLGSGAMARVWQAGDLVLGRQVAVKVLDPALARDPEYVARFAREARNAAMLPPHAGIVGIYDSGVDDGGAVYLVMELVTGRTLSEQLTAYGPLDPGEACRIAAEVAGALAVAHGAGLVHRDIKPANIMLTGAGGVKVVDFGIARAQAGEALTRAGAVLGSPAYMAPEQITGGQVDARTDLYSLGVALYEMLTGTPPFAGDDQFAVLQRHLSEIPTPPSALRPGISGQIDQVVAQLLAKDPGARPQTAEDAAQLITAAYVGGPASLAGISPNAIATQGLAAHGTQGAQGPQGAQGTRVMAASSGSSGSGRRAAAEAGSGWRRRPDVVVVGVVAALALAGLAVWALVGSGTPGPAAAASTTSTTPSASSSASPSSAQIVVPTASAAPSTASSSPSASPSPTASPSVTSTSFAQALDALQQTVAAQGAAGALKSAAEQNLDKQIQNMRQIITQAETQISQNPQNKTQIQQNAVQQLNDQIRNMRQQLADFVQHGSASPAAATAINNALDQLKQTLA
jgi:eukaryotic-like serine/threonine-protein kinase